MGRTRRLLALSTFGAVALPPLAAAILRSRYKVSALDDDELRVAAIFEGDQVRVTSGALRRGEAVTWYGALDLDLRGASLDPAGARLRVIALFAGARVIVPLGWDVHVRPVGILGGVDARVEPPVGAAPRLTIDAIAVFAGIQITDVLTEEEPDVLIAAPLTAAAGAVEPDGTVDAAFERAEAEARLEAAAEEAASEEEAKGALAPEAADH
jgi:hypothetical protein